MSTFVYGDVCGRGAGGTARRVCAAAGGMRGAGHAGRGRRRRVVGVCGACIGSLVALDGLLDGLRRMGHAGVASRGPAPDEAADAAERATARQRVARNMLLCGLWCIRGQRTCAALAVGGLWGLCGVGLGVRVRVDCTVRSMWNGGDKILGCGMALFFGGGRV